MAEEVKQCERMGVNPKWPSFKSVLGRLKKGPPVDDVYHLGGIREYVTREDAAATKKMSNDIGITNYKAEWIACLRAHELLATAPDNSQWSMDLARWIRYYQVGVKQQMFWHHRFRIIFPDHSHGGLFLCSFQRAANMMAVMAMVGWKDAVVYQGYITHAMLNRKYNFQLEHEEEHRRAQAFMLRLFADWVGDVSHQWPTYAYDEPIYEALLAQWRTPNPDDLVPCLLAACDRHTWQSGKDSLKKFYDFNQDWRLERVPVEILFFFRLREWSGLANPVLDHPLMAAPFDRLPAEQPVPELDDLMQGVLKRAREDWPQYDEVLSFDALKAPATLT